LISTRLI